MKKEIMFLKIYKSKSALMLIVMMLLSVASFAQPKAPSTLHNPLAQALVIIMVLLAIAIAILGNVVNQATAMFRENLRRERAAKSTAGSAVATIVMLAGALLFSVAGIAQAADATATAAAAPAADTSINGLSPFTFWLMIAVIAVEIIILIVLVYQLKFLVGIERQRMLVTSTEEPAKSKEGWWWRLNKSKSITEEKEIDLSHDYDGISELDNKLPPWWIAAFAVTIVFAFVYMYRYHVAHSAPLMIEELEISMKKADEEKAAFLAKSGGNVDENTVKMLDASGIAAGKALFTANCTPCHGPEGQGATVGPNLTDNYWIHGGKINDVFKTIKYGWVEKGMRSWKDDFSPIQIAQLASFVKSLKGSNPANPKAPQGELFDENQGAAPKADSAATKPK